MLFSFCKVFWLVWKNFLFLLVFWLYWKNFFNIFALYRFYELILSLVDVLRKWLLPKDFKMKKKICVIIYIVGDYREYEYKETCK